MRTPRTTPLFVFAAIALGSPLSAAAQHEHHASPYAEGQSSEIPTLTPDEIAQLRAGEGMGLARPAELNHYPGPKHVLELAEALGLSAEQTSQVTEIRVQMTHDAVAAGERILEAESHLGELFATGNATLEQVERITGHLAGMRGQLRAIHLAAHISTTDLLTDEQIDDYDRLRGYAAKGL